MPLGYRAGLDIDQWQDSFTELKKFASTPFILMPCGSGSMPPQPEIPQAVKNWNQTQSNAEMKMASPREFFQALESSQKKFGVVEGELYDDELAEVFPQVCSSRAWIVQGSRECEGLLITAEEFATIAWLLGAQYPTDEFQKAWEKVLFIAFHDIITGCGVDEIYEEVKKIFATLKTELTEILTNSLTYMTKKINTNGKGIVVFNPLPWPTKNWVQDSNGQGFAAELPPLGYKVYNTIPQEKEPVNNIRIERNKIDTVFWTLEVDENNGTI